MLKLKYDYISTLYDKLIDNLEENLLLLNLELFYQMRSTDQSIPCKSLQYHHK